MAYVVWWEDRYQDGREEHAKVCFTLEMALKEAAKRAEPMPSIITEVRIFELGNEIPVVFTQVTDEVEVVKKSHTVATVAVPKKKRGK